MSSLSRIARWHLAFVYYLGRLAGILNAQLDLGELKLRAPSQWSRGIVNAIRAITFTIYCTLLVNVIVVIASEWGTTDAPLTVIPKVLLYFMPPITLMVAICHEELTNRTYNELIRIIRKVIARTRTQHDHLQRNLLLHCDLKLAISAVATCMEFNGFLSLIINERYKADVLTIICAVLLMYLYVGVTLRQDLCTLQFIGIGLIYKRLGAHLEQVSEYLELLTTIRPQLSRYQRMQLLLQYADEIEEFDRIYTCLYHQLRTFIRLHQWCIVHSLIYNIGLVLLLTYGIAGIIYGRSTHLPYSLVWLALKLANIIMLTMGAEFAQRQAEVPLLLPLPLLCTGLDQRWDDAIELFVSQRQSEVIEVRVFGCFCIDNRCLLLIVSSSCTYLMLSMQFLLSIYDPHLL